jgi:hypothetical protein
VNRRKLAWLLSGALLVVIILGLVWYRLFAEPTYNGKTLSQWLELAQPENTEACNAVATTGTKALPFLMKWIQYRPSRFRLTISRALWRHFGINHFPFSNYEDSKAEERRADDCANGLSLLGTNAYSAVPQLCALAHDADDRSRVPKRALDALASMGRIGEPCMLSFLAPGTVPELLKMLNSGDNELTMGAVIALGNIAKVPEQSVPALIKTLQNTNSDPTLSILSAKSLRSFGTNAAAAVPALLSQTQPGKPVTLQAEARMALQRIDAEALDKHGRASP